MEKFPSIDYEDMISDLNEDMEQGYINEGSSLYILRQKTPVFVSCAECEGYPVLDYFYDRPVLKEELSCMTVKEARKLAKELNEETYRIAKENISEDNKIAFEVIEELNNIKYRVLEQRFKEELLED